MNLQHLIYFKKVAEYEHFARAAEELFISPSALSKAISNLEAELGISLFERNGRNIYLNRYGKYFYESVSKAMQEIDSGIRHIQNEANIYTGSIRLCNIFSTGSTYLPTILHNFNTKYPNVHIDLSQSVTQDILDRVINNQLDLGICSEFNQENEYSEISKSLLYREEIFLAVPDNHPLADYTQLSLE